VDPSYVSLSGNPFSRRK